MDINKIYDRFELCIQMDYPSFTEFLDLSELIEVRRNLKIPKGYEVLEFCGFNDDERRMLGFFPNSYIDMIGIDECYHMFPVQLLKISPGFNSDPMFEHRDILGTVLGLGLERKLFGDIIVNEREAYILCHQRGASIVLNEMINVRNTSVNIETKEVDDTTRELAPNAKVLNITIASLRIDGLVKAVGNCSRNEANAMITSGLVKVNQSQVLKNHKQVEEGDILSIRRKGKFKIKEIGNTTKKGRIAITILKYI